MTSDDMLWIVGGDGGIGAAVGAACRERNLPHRISGRRANRLPAERLDLQESPDGWEIPEGPGILLLCAAMTRLADCEKDPEGSRLINVERPVLLAREAARRGWITSFLSTSLVFDGSTPFPLEDWPRSPRLCYGHQKAEAEKRLLAEGHSVARLTKVLTPGFSLFHQWATDLRQGKTIHPFLDLFFCPLSLENAVERLLLFSRSRTGGIAHIAGATDVSYAQAASLLGRFLELPSFLIDPILQKDIGRSNLQAGPYTTLGRSRADFPEIPPASAEKSLIDFFRFLSL